MAARNSLSHKALEHAFQENPLGALGLLHSTFRHQIARFIKSKLWGLPPGLLAEQIKDVYQETMLEMVKVVQSPGFDGHQPLRLVYNIAEKRAIDALRRKNFRPKQDTKGAIDRTERDLAGTRIGKQWKLLDAVVWQEFDGALTEALIDVLTPKQAIVARCFIDNYEDFGARDVYGRLASLVSEVTNETENAATIKQHWLEARRRLVKELIRKGFNFLDAEV